MQLLKELDDIINQTHTSDHAATRARLGGFRQKLEDLFNQKAEEQPAPPETQPPTEASAEGSGPAKLV